MLTSGAAVQWLRDGLGHRRLRGRDARRSRRASTTPAASHFVPALTGLGSPWWDADARGLVTGLTRGTTTAHLVRAALEAIAHQVADVVDALPGAAARAPRRRRRDRERAS